MMRKLKNVLSRMNRLLVLLAVLFACAAGGMYATAETQAELDDYAKLTVQLVADAAGNALPGYVENGQSIFFKLKMSEFNSRELVAFLKANSPADLVVDLSFTGDIEGSYPTEIYPNDFDNVAEYEGKPLFRWWIEEGKIHLRFDDEWVAAAGSGTVLENAEVGFAGVLNVQNKPEDGKVTFHAAGQDFPLQFKTGYELTKAASAPLYRNNQYEVDYTVTFTLDQDMNITGGADAAHYSAKLTLRDVIAASGSALTGDILGVPVLTGPVTGLTVSAANYDTANLFTIGGASVLKKGTYTLKYTMKVDADAAQAKLSGYDKYNTVELLENDASLKVNGETKPLTAQAAIAWNNEISNRFKVDKCIVNQHQHSIVYRSGSDYYVDYYVVVYTKDEFTTFTVADQIIANAVHTDKLPVTLMGANTAEGFWSEAAANGLPELSPVKATVIAPITGVNRNITLTAEDGEILPPGAYYFKVPVRVTDTVKSLSEAAQLKVGTNTTSDATAQIKNKAILDAVDGDTHINETTKEVIGTIYGPDSFIKRGAIEMDSSGNYTIYDKEGLRGKLIRWDVTFGWGVPNVDTVITDTMKGGQVLLANGSTSFDLWDMTSGTPVSLAKLWNKNGTDYIQFGKDASGNETFTFYPGRMSSDPQASTRKFKLTYYTLVPEDTYDFTPMGNAWTVKYEDSVPGTGAGPIPGEEWPQLGESVKLDLKKTWKYIVNDFVTQWLIEIKNPSKIPFDSLTKMIIVDKPRSTTAGGNQFTDGEVWIDHDRMLTDLPLEIDVYAQNGKHERLILGTHFTIKKTHPDYSLGTNGKGGFVIEFNVPAVKELMKPHNAKHFASIGITCYVHNADKGTTGKKWNVTNDAWLDYSVAGMELPDEDATAYVTREYGTVSKTVGSTVNGQTVIYADHDNDGEKEVPWELSIGAGEFRNHPDPITITVTDTLPAEMTLKGLAGNGWKKAFHIWAKNDSTKSVVIDLTDPQFNASFSFDETTNTFTLSFVKPGGDWAIKMGGKGTWASTDIGIRYYTVFKDDALQKALDKASSTAVTVTVPLTNSATVSWWGNTNGAPFANGDAVISDIVLDKQAKWMASAGNKVAYTIDINPYGLTMSEDGVLRLQDAMGDGKSAFLYLQDSFRLYNAETGARLAPGSSASAHTYALNFATDGKSFTLDVPDNTPLRLTYQVKTTKPVGTQDVTLENTASLEGRTISPVQITFDVNSSYQSGSFSVEDDEAGVRILKIDSRDADKDTPKGLTGAKFNVTAVDPSGQPTGEPVTYTTDADGFITILEKINVAKILLVEEIQAPDNYMLGEEPWKWCYVLVPYGMVITDGEAAGVGAALGCDVTVVNAGTYAQDVVTNDPFAVSIVKKNNRGEVLYGAEFTLTDAAGASIKPDADSMAGTVKFSGLEPGAYTLTETKAPAGYKLSDEYSWTFIVAEDGAVSLPANAAYTLLSLDGEKLTVVNEPLVVDAQFSGSKTLTGKALEAGQFSFELVDADGKVIEKVTNAADGSFVFTALNYELADAGKTYTYEVREAKGDIAGVTYDDTVHTVTVEVTDNGDGTLTATASNNANALVFTNEYTATGSAQFSGSKTLTGKALEAGQFSFELVAADDKVIETVTNAADGSFAFTALNYELADAGKTYTYEVREVKGSIAGVTYDDTVHTVTVEVTDNGDGTLTATTSANAAALTFANEYTATGSVQFSGNKTLTGKALEAGQFSFELVAADGKVIETVTNAADGTFTFTALNYELDDAGKAYTYEVREAKGDIAGVTYDDTVHTVTVEVSDNGDGTLTATASANAAALTFTNEYNATGSVQFSGSKTLTGKPLEAGQFSFELVAADGKVIEKVTNAADGSFAFTALNYELDDAGKAYTYEVREAKGDIAGVTYDDTVHTVTVEVTDNGDGTLTATASDNAAALNFTNVYEATGSMQLTARKTVNHGEPAAEQVFEFLLEGKGVSMTASNAGASIVFDALDFTLDDVGKTFTYTVRETTLSSGNMISDLSVYTVEVTPVDNQDGTLTVTPVITLNGEAADGIVFNNVLEAPLTISKKVAGCKTEEAFAVTVCFFNADGTEMKKPVSYTGDLSGEIISGGHIELAHGQSITFAGLLPGMVYTVEEEANIAFTTTVNGLPMNKVDGVCTEGGNRADFVNTLKTTEFSIRKFWDGEQGSEIILTLYANGQEMEPQPAYTRDGDAYTYTDLPMYDEDGDLVVYAAKEKYMDGYLTIYDNIFPYEGESSMIYDGGTIINRSVTSLRVRKVWSGLEEGEIQPEITLTLYCNDEATSRKQPEPNKDGWYTYKNLPLYVNGERATYYVLEEAVDGYAVIYTDANGEAADRACNGYTITNQKIPATGDNASLMLWAAMLTASSAMLLMLCKRRRKEI